MCSTAFNLSPPATLASSVPGLTHCPTKTGAICKNAIEACRHLQRRQLRFVKSDDPLKDAILLALRAELRLAIVLQLDPPLLFERQAIGQRATFLIERVNVDRRRQTIFASCCIVFDRRLVSACSAESAAMFESRASWASASTAAKPAVFHLGQREAGVLLPARAVENRGC